MDKDLIKQLVKDRDEAFIEAVTKDDFTKFKAYCRKYGVPMPASTRIMKAAVYKAVRECTNIPSDVKELAAQKCLAMGFTPTMY